MTAPVYSIRSAQAEDVPALSAIDEYREGYERGYRQGYSSYGYRRDRDDRYRDRDDWR